MRHIRTPALRLLAGLAPAWLAAACAAPLPPQTFAAATPELRPEAFFAGSTSSWGVVQDSNGAPLQQLWAHSLGRPEPGGGFAVDQSIRFVPGQTKTRSWSIRRVDPHHYVASLTDAAGPVRGEVYGNMFHLAYRTKGAPVQIEQWLYLQPDGRTVINELTAKVLGVTVRRVSERISRDDGVDTRAPALTTLAPGTPPVR